MTIRAYLGRLAEPLGRTRRDRDRELYEELDGHLQLHIEDNIRNGMPAPEARRQALIKLGGVQQVVEQCRDVSVETRLADKVRNVMCWVWGRA